MVISYVPWQLYSMVVNKAITRKLSSKQRERKSKTSFLKTIKVGNPIPAHSYNVLINDAHSNTIANNLRCVYTSISTVYSFRKL